MIRTAILSSLAIVAAACSQPGEKGVLHVELERDGARVGVVAGRIDFGRVSMGTVATERLFLVNRGDGAMRVSLTEEGFPSEGPTFVLSHALPKTLAPGEELEVEVDFLAREVAGVLSRGVEARLLFTTGPDVAPVAVTLVGQAVSAACLVPEPMNFGAVNVNGTNTLTWVLTNPTDAPVRIELAALSANDPFRFGPGSSAGVFELAARGTLTVGVVYQPQSVGNHAATVRVTFGDCGVVTRLLEGRAVQHSLAVSANSSTHCGAVPVGASMVQSLSLENTGEASVRVSSFSTEGEAFALVNAPTELVVAPSESADVQVRCSPRTAGMKAGELRFEVVGSGPVSVGLQVFGGGPVLDVTSAIEFGKVWTGTTSASTWTAEMPLRLKNTGTSAGGRFPLTLSGFALTADDANTLDGEFSVISTETALKGDESATVLVSFTPKSAGPKRAVLRIQTNEFARAFVEITLSAEAVASPSCQASLEVSTIDFGRSAPASRRTLWTAIRNVGTTSCLVRPLPISSEGFASVGSGNTFELAAGARTLIPARLAPTADQVGAITGELQVLVSHDGPPLTIPLLADIGEACIFAAPSDFDFGAVQTGCSSETRTVRLYNRCATGMTLTSSSIESPRPTGCTSVECAETRLDGSGGGPIPPSWSSSPLTIPVRYAPTDDADDVAYLRLTVGQGASSATYVISLRGAGASTSVREERFATRTQADVLFTLDDSGSGMQSGVLEPMAASLSHFRSFADAQGIDWQFGVTTTDMQWPTRQGRLVSGADHPEKVLTAQTSYLPAQWAAKIQVGIAGSATEMILAPSVAALSPPLSHRENAGFLREDAVLGILGATNARDQSPESAAYYVDQLLSVKGFNRLNDVSFSVVGGFSETPISGCAPYDSGRDTGLLRSVAHALGGHDIEYCDFAGAAAAIMTRVGERTMGLRYRYFLQSVPADIEAIAITNVHGPLPREVPGRGAAWTYDALANAVDFAPGFEPLPGDGVTMRYERICHTP